MSISLVITELNGPEAGLLSVFSIHNETLNVWTNLIGFFLLLSLTIYTAMKVPNVVDLYLPIALRNADFQILHAKLISRFPSLPHMPDLHRLREELKTSLPSMNLSLYLSSWHIMELNCLPENLTHSNHTDTCVLHSVKEDVANIIALLLVRPITRQPFFAFLGVTMLGLLPSSRHPSTRLLLHVLSFLLQSLHGVHHFTRNWHNPGIPSPSVPTPKYRTFRASLFFAMGFSGAAPILHKLILFWHQPEAFHTTGYEVLMGLFYGKGAVVYAIRIPERWMRGKLDIAGHSHQLFHVLVVAGAFTHYRAGLVYLRWRYLQGC